MVFYRIIGALSSTVGTKGGGCLYVGLERFVGPSKTDTFGQDYEFRNFINHLRQCKLVFLGEVHSVPTISQFQYQIIQALTPLSSSSSSSSSNKQTDDDKEEEEEEVTSALPSRRKLHIVMEHFALDMQDLLDAYCRRQLTFDQLVQRYRQDGDEGHDLLPYRALLQHAQAHADCVTLHAGFVPKRVARTLMKQGPDVALQQAAQWLPRTPSMFLLQGLTPFHYNYFESLLTGRNLHLSLATPSDRFVGIFQAQVLKDVGMAHKINQLLSGNNSSDEDNEEKNHDPNSNDTTAGADDQIVVIAGNGHVEYHQGVPERVLQANPHLVDKTCLVTCHCAPLALLQDSTAPHLLEMLHLGARGANPADFVFLFPEEDWLTQLEQEEEEETEQKHHFHDEKPPLPHPSTSTKSSLIDHQSKEETRAAYNQVGETAHLRGNLARAHAIMRYLGYTDKEIEVAGSDAYNFQGVGNPHGHAHIQPGETVLDIGSGLGIDSFIAAERTGPRGRLIGIDIAAKDVAYAQRRADERGLDIRFATADMERLPLPDNSFDVVISNGAFCLAPNKRAAFAEIFRVLKPGGRMVVCTSTIQTPDSLEKGVEWPICMRMFIEKNKIQPMCEEIGFVDVQVDDRDSKMVFELELPEEATPLNPERYRVHGDSPEFAHLEKYNMDQLCARVCVVAKKPWAMQEEKST